MDNWCWAACSVMVGTYNTNSKITQEDIVSEIDSNKPFSVSMQWDSGSGAHTIVCAGYNVNNNSIRIIDPAQGCGVNYYKYNDIIDGTTIKSGKGKCIRMLTYKFV